MRVTYASFVACDVNTFDEKEQELQSFHPFTLNWNGWKKILSLNIVF